MTVTLSPELEDFINEKVNRGAYTSVTDAVNDTLRMRQINENIHEAMMQGLPEATRETVRQAIQKDIDFHTRDEYSDTASHYVPPTAPPEWVRTLAPRNPPTDGTNGLHRAVGKWPGDETETELLLLEKQMDDEDAGRA